MKKISISFPANLTVRASLLTEQEPVLVENVLSKLATPQKFVCNHSVSAGKIFDAYMRPAEEPAEKPKGNRLISASELHSGDILWDGEKLSVVYGDVVQPGVLGCVIGHAEVNPVFDKACLNIWYDIYREHSVSVITVAEE